MVAQLNDNDTEDLAVRIIKITASPDIVNFSSEQIDNPIEGETMSIYVEIAGANHYENDNLSVMISIKGPKDYTVITNAYALFVGSLPKQDLQNYFKYYKYEYWDTSPMPDGQYPITVKAIGINSNNNTTYNAEGSTIVNIEYKGT